MQDIPSSVSIPFRVNENVADFCRRIFVEAARVVGLPLIEQGLFADALIAQYPDKAKRTWVQDPTPRDGDASIQPSDFNYQLLRQYLNEHPGAGRQIVSLKQIKSVEGKVFSDSSLDEVTRDELGKWRQDFIYRGGELFTGLEAPISRQGLVPTLQLPAATPDLTWIPRIMRSKNWNHGAVLMEEWLRRQALVRPARIEDTANNFGPPLLNVIKMDWVLDFKRAKDVYDAMIRNKIWTSDKAKPVIGGMLTRTGITAKIKANQNDRVPFGDLSSSNVVSIEDNHVQFGALKLLSPPMDGLTAALANFSFHLAIMGHALYTQNGIRVTVEKVGIYVKDSYDFINDGTFYIGCLCYDQPLGSWEQNVGNVSNDTFNNWRRISGRGGDYLIYSDIKVVELTQPDVFIVPF